ncbi:RNA polymerase sigma factor CnrH [Delftia tsuruhatensis]|uniref:RNA polymerase sigma factor n=1 Tax=Delftia tsuruhatensis TaxID=180282 RepID=UPI001E7A5595|nr:sigma-70 family RNA polymerase sigma factor [Delftia tsuruhatensis]CAB5722152.1 RNA polymerase sigma factor CnrH [Delftia tsuruhatensis]CAC9686611.1 RNA polymerase sigma factor CnrH [Delftia tsuruhatensis]
MDRSQILEHLPGLRRYARLLAGDAWAADDLVQDTLERACRKWLLWRPDGDLRAWLFTLMHNLYLNQRRSAARGQWLDLDSVSETLAAPEDGSEAARDLERCLQRLPAEQRAVLLLVSVEDMSYADTARVLQLPLGTVMSRLSRARTRLRELMEAPATAAPAPPSAAQPPALRRLK